MPNRSQFDSAMVSFLRQEQQHSCSVILEEREKAWHVFSLLGCIGHAASVDEIASCCGLFDLTPEYIRYLCSIPDSPVRMVSDRIVTVSAAGFGSYKGFLPQPIEDPVWRGRTRVSGGNTDWFSDVITYYRKRKRSETGSSVVIPAAKRKACLLLEEGEEDRATTSPRCQVQEVFSKTCIASSWDIPSVYLPVHEECKVSLEKEYAIARLHLDSIAEFLRSFSADKRHAMTDLREVFNWDNMFSMRIDLALSRLVEVRRLMSSKVEYPALCEEAQAGCSNIPATYHLEAGELKIDQQTKASVCGYPTQSHVSETISNLSGKSGGVHDFDAIGGPADPEVAEGDDCRPSCYHLGADELHIGSLREVEALDVCDEDIPIGLSFGTTDICKVTGESTVEIWNQTCGRRFKATDHEEADEHQTCSPSKATLCGNSIPDRPKDELLKIVERSVGIDERDADGLDSGPSQDRRNSLKGPSKPDNEVRTELLSFTPADYQLPDCSYVQKETIQSFSEVHSVHETALPSQLKALIDPSAYKRVVKCFNRERHHKDGKKLNTMRPKMKLGHKKTEEIVAESCSTKSQLEHKTLPQFDSFLVEHEEGSGGYGTVYRAKSKKDGKRFAIKCPHENAHRHHVNNEQKMLERFGGRNFIINYRGTFRSGSADCFILEHVEHDRPEALKKEIDIFELQWYGYCLFKALAYLHKQGVIHRDVKPGNFLFSRYFKKGYLIDFNLAMDLHQKKAVEGKPKSRRNASVVDHVPLPHSYFAATSKEKKLMKGESFTGRSQTRAGSQPIVETKVMKKEVTVGPRKTARKLFGSQGGDGSGVTSTKDATSTRTPSAKRLKEPVPCMGRKELIDLVQGARQNLKQDSVNIFASQRKRISASPVKVDHKLLYLSPMPLHCSGVPVPGAGLPRSKGDGKLKRDGPCVGTKGFRAPEVLLRSSYQGPKIDVWSAGVTLLYLTVGRTPFAGDPEENIKDIAKLTGSEGIWELAKLHDRESSFPPELLDMQSLPSMKLHHWCKAHTKRTDFLKLIPPVLYDLIQKCLTVNPRLRISAEDALRHEFFAPCHESLRKHRLRRQQLSISSEASEAGHLLHGPSQLSQAL